MLKSFILLFTTMLCMTVAISQTTIQGKITEAESGEAVPFAAIKLYKKGIFVKGVESDFDGKYSFENLVPGTYDLEVISLNLQSQSISGIKAKDGKVCIVNVQMEEVANIGVDEIVIREYCNRLVDFDNTITGKKMTAAPMTSFAMGHSGGSIMTARKELPSAGQMTAGEWNDLNNWEDWKALLEEPDYKSMQSYWSIFPVNRYSVFVTNENGTPILNATVKLWSSSNELLWESMTDNAGKAELWEGINGKESKSTIDKITVEKENNTFTIKNPKAADEGTNHLTLALSCPEGNQVDIAFIVDATGSMGDEIDFLRAELSDIIEAVQNENTEIDYRTASVFYKDHKEDYLTSISPLDVNIKTTSDFIKTKSAGGGGDYEEAVEEGIQEALSLEWNENAIARLAFLVLDAPPHQTPEVIEQLQNQIAEAASRGIKIIPITASGINRQTEFLMKFLSISTNATYVFLTDDSGIGDAHLDPIVEDYEVEKLNDLIIRLINNYGHLPNCDETQLDKKNDLSIKVFPNPASEFVTVNLDQKVDRIVIRSASGMIVLKEDSPKQGDNRLRLDNLVGGMYTVSVEKDGKRLSTQSLIVID